METFKIANAQTDRAGIKGHAGYIEHNNVPFSKVTCPVQNIMYGTKL